MLLFSCNGGQNFTEFPGFTEHFTRYPPKSSLPDTAEITLLKKYQPKIYKASDQPGPIDFYADYVAHGALSLSGKKISDTVTAELLNQYRDNPHARFVYTGDNKINTAAKVYARIDYERTEYKARQFDFTFLTYNLVFPVSGILKGLGKLQSLALGISGNLDDWHQLDHYISVTVALLDNQAIAMTLQQHNYHTTYLLNEKDHNIVVDIAMRSNELYPHTLAKKSHPAVSFLTKDNMEFIVNGKEKPMMAAYDVTHGTTEVDYQLIFLPPNDAFYQFKGSLGKKRLLPGRSGPPGADYATLPGLMPRVVRLFTGFRPDSAEQEVNLWSKLFDKKTYTIHRQAIKAYKTRFFSNLNKP